MLPFRLSCVRISFEASMLRESSARLKYIHLVLRLVIVGLFESRIQSLINNKINRYGELRIKDT